MITTSKQVSKRKEYDFKGAYTVTKLSLGNNRWCHTNYIAVPPYKEYFKHGEDGVAYAIWANITSVFTGDDVLQAYVEFYEPVTLQYLQNEFGGYWNEATYYKTKQMLYFFDLDVIKVDGPWELHNKLVKTDTESDTQFIAIEYEPPSHICECEDTRKEEQPDPELYVQFGEDMEDSNEEDEESSKRHKHLERDEYSGAEIASYRSEHGNVKRDAYGQYH